MVKTFRDLRVWQKAMKLVKDVYETTSDFPEEEKFGLVSQMNRASVSIPSNIAEGFGRRSNKEFKRYLNISSGSLYELQTQIELAYMLNMVEEKAFSDLIEASREVERMLSALIRSI